MLLPFVGTIAYSSAINMPPSMVVNVKLHAFVVVPH